MLFLVPGDQKRYRALRFAPICGQMIEHGRDLAGNRALHVNGAAAEQHAILDLPGERGVAPVRRIPGGTTSVCPASTRLGDAVPMRA